MKKHFLSYFIITVLIIATALGSIAEGKSTRTRARVRQSTRQTTTTYNQTSPTVRRSTQSTQNASTAGAANKRKITVQKPDLDYIQKETLNPKSKFYFPELKKKYDRNDTIMTNEEFRMFYLGYMFQEDYDPYRKSEYEDKTDELRMKQQHSKEERELIREYATLALQDNPFDLRQMSFLIHVLREMGKNMSAKIWEFRLENLLGAIKSTGTGESPEDAWFVIYPVHEYDLIGLMGYEATDADYIEPGYDYLSVVPDAATQRRVKGTPAKGFYFNVAVPQAQYELKHPEIWPDEDETSSEINGEEED